MSEQDQVKAMDNAKVLRWLGYDPAVWTSKDGFTNTRDDPGLDYLILKKVRGLGKEVIETVEVNLNSLYMSRWVDKDEPETPTTLELHIWFHLPGDYAEASRFLWEEK